MGQKDFARLTFSLGSRSTPNLKKIRDLSNFTRRTSACYANYEILYGC